VALVYLSALTVAESLTVLVAPAGMILHGLILVILTCTPHEAARSSASCSP
jgi:hypothetical protein